MLFSAFPVTHQAAHPGSSNLSSFIDPFYFPKTIFIEPKERTDRSMVIIESRKSPVRGHNSYTSNANQPNQYTIGSSDEA
jgi:hypothetical protein